MKIKLIHSKTGVVREVDENYELKLRLLKDAGFVLAKDYKTPVVKAPEPEPSLAEVVKGQREKIEISGVEVAAEKAIHEGVVPPAVPEEKPRSVPISPAVRNLLAEHGLDPSLIEGTGKNGAIKSVDVLKYLESAEGEGEEASTEAE